VSERWPSRGSCRRGARPPSGVDSCALADNCPGSSSNPRVLFFGLLLSFIGDGSVPVGVGLMISGAVQRPVELQ
jgi:hypothetical protein